VDLKPYGITNKDILLNTETVLLINTKVGTQLSLFNIMTKLHHSSPMDYNLFSDSFVFTFTEWLKIKHTTKLKKNKEFETPHELYTIYSFFKPSFLFL